MTEEVTRVAPRVGDVRPRVVVRGHCIGKARRLPCAPDRPWFSGPAEGSCGPLCAAYEGEQRAVAEGALRAWWPLTGARVLGRELRVIADRTEVVQIGQRQPARILERQGTAARPLWSWKPLDVLADHQPVA